MKTYQWSLLLLVLAPLVTGCPRTKSANKSQQGKENAAHDHKEGDGHDHKKDDGHDHDEK